MGIIYDGNLFSRIRSQIQRFVNYLDETQVGTQIATVVVVTNRRTAMKQRFVDLFEKSNSNIRDIVDGRLDFRFASGRLKRFYKELEDIWNYRANLPHETKCLIVPPNGQLFFMPVIDYLNCSSKLELQEILSKTSFKCVIVSHRKI